MSLRVLIVDDLEFMRTVIREILEQAGFEIAGEAVDGEEGVAMFNRLKPDLVLMDITMPVMDGIEALQQIKKHHQGATVIMCSALGQQEYIIKAIQFGARDCVVKPFNPERIISAIHKATYNA